MLWGEGAEMKTVEGKGLPTREIPNDMIASSARQFREAADFLYAHIEGHTYAAPLLMVASFGIELFLKSLNSKLAYHQGVLEEKLGGYLVTAEPQKQGHHLVTLYEALEPTHQEELSKAYALNPVVPNKAT